MKRMRPIIRIFLPAAAALTLAACSTESEITERPAADTPVALRITADIGGGEQTRVAYGADLTAKFEAGDTIYVVANQETYKYIRKDDGTWAADGTPYYFQNSDEVSFQAWYCSGYNQGKASTVEGSDEKFKTGFDQPAATLTADNWSDWDILVADEVKANIADPSVSFKFQHIKSLLNFTIRIGDGFSEEDTITADEILLKGIVVCGEVFDMKTLALTEGDDSEEIHVSFTGDEPFVDKRKSSVPVVVKAGTATPILRIEIREENEPDPARKNSYTTDLPVPEGGFKAGMCYHYTITVDKSEVSSNQATIVPWDEPSSTSGDATMREN